MHDESDELAVRGFREERESSGCATGRVVVEVAHAEGLVADREDLAVPAPDDPDVTATVHEYSAYHRFQPDVVVEELSESRVLDAASDLLAVPAAAVGQQLLHGHRGD